MDNQYKALMIDILSDLVENHGVVACKAEFEAEGSRADGITVLTDIVRKANTGFVLKIGGCEAVRDLLDTDTYLNRRFALSHSDWGVDSKLNINFDEMPHTRTNDLSSYKGQILLGTSRN